MFQGKLPLSGMTVNRCEDVEKYPNGFEISGMNFIFEKCINQIYHLVLLIYLNLKKVKITQFILDHNNHY